MKAVLAAAGAIWLAATPPEPGETMVLTPGLTERVDSWMEFPDIPDGRGIDYFYGTWRNEHAGGPLTVTDGVLAHYQSSVGPEIPYRILFTGRNYALVVYQATLIGGKLTGYCFHGKRTATWDNRYSASVINLL